MKHLKAILLVSIALIIPLILGTSSYKKTGGNLDTFRVDIDGDGTVDCLDRNGDRICEEGWPFDADGDGSSSRVTCTAVGRPLPSCLFNGDVINQDYVDDTNCFIPRINGDAKGSAEECFGNDGYRLAAGAIYHLPSGVAQIRFPCWDFNTWDADSGTPSSAPAASVANDPRAAANHDNVNDAAFGHCPKDEWGAEVFAISWGSWDGVVQGEGTDLRTHQRMIADGYLLGSYVRDDRGNNNDGWFGLATFVGGEIIGWQLGACGSANACDSENGTGAMSPARLSTTLGSTVGFGKIQDTPGVGLTGARDDWTTETQHGYMCVCNDLTGCGNTPATSTPGFASALDWTEGLIAGQRLIVNATWRLGQTSPMAVEVTMSRDGADAKIGICSLGDSASAYEPCDQDSDCTGGGTCSMCGDPQEIMIQFGHMQQLEDALVGNEHNAQQGIGGMDTAFDSTSGANSVFAPDPAFFNGGVTFDNITFNSNDTWNTTGDLCADTFLSEGELHNPGADGSTDPDCDTHPYFHIFSGENATFRNNVFKEWGHFPIDQGGNLTGFLRVLDNTWIHGYGQAVGDFGYGVLFRDNIIKSSMFRNTVMGMFGNRMQFERTLVENVTIAGGFISFSGQTNSSLIDTKFIGVTWNGSLIVIQSGSRYIRIQNVLVEGTVNKSGGSSTNFVIRIIGNNATYPTFGNIIDNIVMTGSGIPASSGGQQTLVSFDDDDRALGAGAYGNFISNITSMHTDIDSCLISTTDADEGTAELLLEKNTFTNLNTGNGRVFCFQSGANVRSDPDDGTVPNVRGMVIAGVPKPDPIVVCHSLNLNSDGSSDNNVLFNGDYNYRIQNAWCQMAVTQAQVATITFKDDSANAVTGTVTCTVPGGAPIHTIMTTGNSLTAGESLIFDNATAPTASVNVVVCADIIAEWL